MWYSLCLTLLMGVPYHVTGQQTSHSHEHTNTHVRCSQREENCAAHDLLLILHTSFFSTVLYKRVIATALRGTYTGFHLVKVTFWSMLETSQEHPSNSLHPTHFLHFSSHCECEICRGVGVPCGYNSSHVRWLCAFDLPSAARFPLYIRHYVVWLCVGLSLRRLAELWGCSGQPAARHQKANAAVSVMLYVLTLLVTLASLICITGIWFDQRRVDHKGAGVSHLSYVQQSETAISSYCSSLISDFACDAQTISARKMCQLAESFWCYLSKTDSTSSMHHQFFFSNYKSRGSLKVRETRLQPLPTTRLQLLLPLCLSASTYSQPLFKEACACLQLLLWVTVLWANLFKVWFKAKVRSRGKREPTSNGA